MSTGFFHARIEALMSAPTHLVSAQLARDLTSTLARLRLARAMEDETEIRVLTRRLDWLLDKVGK